MLVGADVVNFDSHRKEELAEGHIGERVTKRAYALRVDNPVVLAEVTERHRESVGRAVGLRSFGVLVAGLWNMIACSRSMEEPDMADLRIFSYLPNPRIWKATIAARLCGVDIEIFGAPPRELKDWLWDFDARPLTQADKASGEYTREARTGFAGRLYKTDAFLEAHPFGTVPAAFSPDGAVGIFESNSIMRAVVRLGHSEFGLYGNDPYTASRIDSFLDASLVFARDSQVYLLSLAAKTVTREIYDRAAEAFSSYMSGIDKSLAPNRVFIVSDRVTLADICFVCEYALFSREAERRSALATLGVAPITDDSPATRFPRATSHFERLCAHEAFAADLGPFLTAQRSRIEASASG